MCRTHCAEAGVNQIRTNLICFQNFLCCLFPCTFFGLLCFVIFSPYLCIGNHSCSRSLKVPDPLHHCLGRADQVCCCYTCTINENASMFLTKECLIWCLMSWLKVGMWYWFADFYFLFVIFLMILMIRLQISLTETGLSPCYIFPWKERMKTVIAWQT